MRQKDRKTEQKEMKSLLKQLQLSKKQKSGTYGTEKAWNSGTCGTGKWEKKEDKCEFYEKQDAYCTKT